MARLWGHIKAAVGWLAGQPYITFNDVLGGVGLLLVYHGLSLWRPWLAPTVCGAVMWAVATYASLRPKG